MTVMDKETIAKSATKNCADSRLQIAIQILRWTTGGLIIIALAMVIGAAWTGDAQKFLDTVDKIFTALLPLLGTWVGTVLAFYFSKDNFETASESVRKTIKETREERLITYVCGDVMRPYDKITSVEIDDPDPKAPEKVLEKNLKTDFIDKLSDTITRIPVFTKSGHLAKYLLHKAILHEFFDELQSDSATTIKKDQATLKDLINYKDKYKTWAESSFAFVAKNATLATAKDAMKRQAQDTKQSCQDVFVTENGNKNEKVLGWLTDKRIERYAKLGE
jgi:hypothetical protein